MESLGQSQKDAQSRNKWRRRIKGQPANPGSPGKMAVKTERVCVCSGVTEFWSPKLPFPIDLLRHTHCRATL